MKHPTAPPPAELGPWGELEAVATPDGWCVQVDGAPVALGTLLDVQTVNGFARGRIAPGARPVLSVDLADPTGAGTGYQVAVTLPRRGAWARQVPDPLRAPLYQADDDDAAPGAPGA